MEKTKIDSTEIDRINQELADYQRKMDEFFGYKMSEVPQNSGTEEKGRHWCGGAPDEGLAVETEIIPHNGSPILLLHDETNMANCGCRINFCPFCGEELK